MPIRRGMGGVSSGAGGNLFDRPGFFDYAEIDALVLNTDLLLKTASETYGIYLGHGDTSGASQHYTATIPALSADGEMVITTATQTLTNKTYVNPVLTTLLDANGNEQIIFTPVSSAANYLEITNSAASSPPIVKAAGSDANIDITLEPKGTGVVNITGNINVQGTSTTVNSTTLDVDDKNITMGSVSTPTDVTANLGGITLKGATDKTIIWDNADDNWTANQDWNIPTGKVFKINNVSVLNSTTLGAGILNSSLTSTDALTGGSIASGFGTISTTNAITTTSTITGGRLDIDNISINGNTISSTDGNLILDAVGNLNFSDDAIINIGSLAIDSIVGDNNAIQIGDNSDDAVTIYRVNALTAIGDLDIGSHDFRAATLTADGLSSGRVLFAGSGGLISGDASNTFTFNDSTNTLGVSTIEAGNINAFTLGGKLTGGSNEIEGSNFDIDGGAIDAATLGANSAITVSGGEIAVDLTWTSAQTAIDIDSGTINGLTALGIKQAATSYEMQIAVGSTSLSAHRVLTIDPNNAARTIEISGNITFGNNFTTGSHALTLTTSGTTDVTLPTTGTLATLAGSETLSNKTLTAPTIASFAEANHDHSNDAGGANINIVSGTSGTLTIARGGTGATSDSNARTALGVAIGSDVQAYDADLSTIAGFNKTANNFIMGTGSAWALTTPANARTGLGLGSLAVLSSINNANWSGTDLAVEHGGTGASTFTNNRVLTGNGTSALVDEANLTFDGSLLNVTGGITISGDLTVNGTTTTVNSTTVTIDDPIFQIGGDTAPSSDDNKDRGIAFRWHNGTTAKNGFFGYDDDTGKFTFIPDATLTNEVVSGTAGTIVATTFEGALAGNATTATTATEATNVTVTANNSTNETTYLTFVDGYTGGTEGIETDSSLTYNPSTGALSAGSFVGTIAGSTVEDNAITDVKLADMPANTVKVRNANSAGDPSNLVVGDTQILIGDGTGFTVAALSGDVTMANTGAVTISDNKIDGDMFLPAVITDHTEITSSSGINTSQDMVMVWDQDANALKKVKLANLGISGTAVGSSNEIQYNNSNSFAAAANVEIKNASLALKEMSAPNNVSGYGLLYAKSDNELYFKDDGGNETKITNGGSLAGGGAFKGIKAYLNANLSIANAASVTVGASPYGSWSESYDVGGMHGSSPTDRFTFGVTGYFHISVQHEWAADSAGYRQIEVSHIDTSNSNTPNVILTDRIEGSNQTTNLSSGSTTVYIDDAADYILIKVYQNSGAALNLIGGDDGTVVTITRLDTASASSVASGGSGHIQLSNGSGGFMHDANAIVWDSTNNRLGVNTASPSYSIDTTASGTVRAATFTGNLTGNVSGSSGSTTGNAATVTNGVYTTGTQTIGGAKTFSDDAVFSGNLSLADDKEIRIGNSDDLQIGYSSAGSGSSYIKDLGGGPLYIDSDGTGIYMRKSNGESMATLLTDGAVTLYHDNSARVATSAAGATITGALTTTDGIRWGNGGTYGAGGIYADSNWGSILTAFTASPAAADWLIEDAAGNDLVRIQRNSGAAIAMAVGGVPNTDWANNWSVLHLGDQTTLSNYPDVGYFLTNNARYDGTNWKYIEADQATNIAITTGQIQFRQATSGSANANITWTYPMTITAAGNVGINNTSPDQKLTVGGHILLTSATDADNANKYGIIANEHYDTDDEEWVMMSGWSQAASHTLAFGGYDNAFNAATEIKFYTAANVTTRTGTEHMKLDSNGVLYVTASNSNTVAKFISSTADAYVHIQDSDSNTSYPPGIHADGDDLYLRAGGDANGWQKGIMLDDDGFIRIKGHVAMSGTPWSFYDIGHADSQWTSAGLRVGGTNGWMIGNTTGVQRISNNSGTFSMLNTSNAWANLQVAEIQINSTIVPYNNNPLKVDNGTNADSSIRVQHNDNYYLELDPDLINMYRASGSAANLTISTTSGGSPASGAGNIGLMPVGTGVGIGTVTPAQKLVVEGGHATVISSRPSNNATNKQDQDFNVVGATEGIVQVSGWGNTGNSWYTVVLGAGINDKSGGTSVKGFVGTTGNQNFGLLVNGSVRAQLETDGDFHVDGDVYAFSGSVSSDIALKENINIVDNALDKVSKLRGVSFDWKREGKGSSIGLIAQDVEPILPELVSEAPTFGDSTDTHKTLNYNGIIGLLVESIKELKDEIQELKNGTSR